MIRETKRATNTHHLVIFDSKNGEIYVTGIDTLDVASDKEAEEIVENFGFSLEKVEYWIVQNLNITIL